MNVSDIMTPAAVCDSADDTLEEAASKMWQQQTGSLLIMEGHRLGGIVTERDVMRTVAEGKDPKSVSLREAMTSNVVTIAPDTGLTEAAQKMFQHWFRHLPVVTSGGDVVGIVSLRDLLGLVKEGLDEPAALQHLTGHKLVRDMRLERVEAGDLD
ncbi:MAG: CBS domain-containing protein [Actinomycetota bacterium]|nr:CBS domain-containing protein [Actinomycetota bacterium]